jgi:hypothetical protein
MQLPPVCLIPSLSVRRRSRSLVFPQLPLSSRPLCSASCLASAPSSGASPWSAISGKGAKPSPLPQVPGTHRVAHRPTHRGYRAANRARATGHPLQSTVAIAKPSGEPLPSPNPPPPNRLTTASWYSRTFSPLFHVVGSPESAAASDHGLPSPVSAERAERPKWAKPFSPAGPCATVGVAHCNSAILLLSFELFRIQFKFNLNF